MHTNCPRHSRHLGNDISTASDDWAQGLVLTIHRFGFRALRRSGTCVAASALTPHFTSNCGRAPAAMPEARTVLVLDVEPSQDVHSVVPVLQAGPFGCERQHHTSTCNARNDWHFTPSCASAKICMLVAWVCQCFGVARLMPRCCLFMSRVMRCCLFMSRVIVSGCSCFSLRRLASACHCHRRATVHSMLLKNSMGINIASSQVMILHWP